MLRVNNLSKTFTIHNLGAKEISGFRPVSFEVATGKTLALSGPSGTGKSSIIKCLYRTYLATSGSIEYTMANGETVNLVKLPDTEMVRLRQREIGYVTQFLRVLPRVSATEIVAGPLIGTGVSYDDAIQRATVLLRRLRIPDELLDAYPVTFSGGEQQRINIARAIIWKPRLLLLDEPTASLDKGSIEIVIELLNELRQQGTTMVMIFHDPDVMHALSDSIYLTQTIQEEECCECNR